MPNRSTPREYAPASREPRIVIGALCAMFLANAPAVAQTGNNDRVEISAHTDGVRDRGASREAQIDNLRNKLALIESELDDETLSDTRRKLILATKVAVANTLGLWEVSAEAAIALADSHKHEPKTRVRWLHEAAIAFAYQASQGGVEEMRKAVELLERAQDEHERVRYASDADRSEAASEIVRGAHGLHTLYLLANVRDEAIATRRRDLLEQAHRLYKHDTNDEHRQVLESVGYTEPRVMLAIGIAEVELGRVDRASSAIRSAVSDAEHKAKIVRELVRSVDRVGRTHWGRVSESVATEIEDPMLFLVFRAEAVRSVPEDDRDEAWENEATWLSDTLQSASSNPDVEAERRNLWLRAGRALEATYHEWTNRSKGETRKSAEPGQGAHHE